MNKSIDDIKAEIAATERQIAAIVAGADDLQAQLSGMGKSLVARNTGTSNALGAEFAALCDDQGDPAACNWQHPLWQNFQAKAGYISGEVRVGALKEDLLSGEHAADLPYGVPLFEANGGILLLHDTSTKDRARQVLQNLTLRTVLLMSNQVRLTLLDPAGMGAAFPFRGFLGRDFVRSSGRSAAEELNEVLDDIRRVNERVIGDAERFFALSAEKRSGETFDIVAAADFPKAYTKDPRAIEYLMRVANAGPRAGRHLILEWNLDEQTPHDFDRSLFNESVTIDLRKEDFDLDLLPEPGLQKAVIETAFAGAKRGDGGDWNAVVRPEDWGAGSSDVRIECPLGERLKAWFGESEEGKQCAHAMIAGQVGSGKSYLLHVMVTGLAARYSPTELRITLIDGKQGVEFEAYRNLPHADVVCLRTAPALARSVLSDYVDEMDRRYELFQAAGVVKLADYRQATGKPLPRCVLVIDEYQQILDGDPERGAALLGRLLEKGRAAGLHAILASQTFEQRGLPSSALTHVHMWGALSLSESYSQSIQVFGTEGKRLIRDLGASAEMVLNDEGGRDGANSRGAIARLRTKEGDDLLPGLVAEIVDRAGSDNRPIVLSGREGALIGENPFVTQEQFAVTSEDELQAIARRSVHDGGFGVEIWNKADRPVPIWLGRRFDVRGHALCPLRRAPGQNLLVMGGQAEARCRMLAIGLASAGALMRPEDLSVTFIEGLREDMPGGGMIAAGVAALQDAGFTTRRLAEEDLTAFLQDAVESVQTVNPTGTSRLFVVSDPEYLYSLHCADRFSAMEGTLPWFFRQLLARGPQAGVHTVLAAPGLASFQLVLSATREAQMFNHRVVQQMNEDESMSLFSSLAAARLNERADHPFAALHVDQIAGTRNAILFNAYAADRELHADQGLEPLRAQLGTIRYVRT